MNLEQEDIKKYRLFAEWLLIYSKYILLERENKQLKELL